MAINENTQNKGLAAQTVNPEFKSPSLHDNSSFNQCLKMFDYLLEHASISTSKAREKLDIYYPLARVFELKRDDCQIVTVWHSWIIKHQIWRYVLTQKRDLIVNNKWLVLWLVSKLVRLPRLYRLCIYVDFALLSLIESRRLHLYLSQLVEA